MLIDTKEFKFTPPYLRESTSVLNPYTIESTFVNLHLIC